MKDNGVSGLQSTRPSIWHTLVLIMLCFWFPMEGEAACFIGYAKKRVEMAVSLRFLRYLKNWKSRLADIGLLGFRHFAAQCDDIQYRLRGIWTIPRQYQSDTF
jgi:hypothetical protein